MTTIEVDERELTTLGEQHRIDGLVTAESPIHTGGNAQTGNKQLFRRQSVYSPDRDEFVEVPVIHGNSVRGHLRRLLLRDLLERVDYTLRDERLYHSLLGGGILQKDGKAEIDAGLRRQVRTYLPPIDLLGMATGNQMFAGTVDVGMLYPVCEELNFRNDTESDHSFYDFLGDDFATRMAEDPDDAGLSDVEFDMDDENDEEDSQSMQQIYEYETLSPGTRFEHHFTLKSHASELARSCLLHGVHLWEQEATIGGMAATGHGELAFEYEADLSGREAYLDHLDTHEDQVIETLDTLSRK